MGGGSTVLRNMSRWVISLRWWVGGWSTLRLGSASPKFARIQIEGKLTREDSDSGRSGLRPCFALAPVCFDNGI